MAYQDTYLYQQQLARNQQSQQQGDATKNRMMQVLPMAINTANNTSPATLAGLLAGGLLAHYLMNRGSSGPSNYDIDKLGNQQPAGSVSKADGLAAGSVLAGSDNLAQRVAARSNPLASYHLAMPASAYMNNGVMRSTSDTMPNPLGGTGTGITLGSPTSQGTAVADAATTAGAAGAAANLANQAASAATQAGNVASQAANTVQGLQQFANSSVFNGGGGLNSGLSDIIPKLNLFGGAS